MIFFLCKKIRILFRFFVASIYKLMSAKTPHNYICNNCNFSTTRIIDYKRHLETKKHLSNISASNIAQISAQLYTCEYCQYSTCRINDYNRHLETKKHLGNISATNIAQLYTCEYCNYHTSDINDYNKHIHTKKHIHKIDATKELLYICDNCNKHYVNRTGLWRHKKKCFNNVQHFDYEEKENKQSVNIDKIISNDITNNPVINVVLELVKQNSEFKELIIEQNKQIIELAKGNNMNNMANCHNNNHNTTNNNTNNNNTHFNLQFFLNETCKDAMNISEFIEQVNVSLTDLENTGRLGYAEGITRIFLKGLKELEINQRPIHCSDAKRETLYIKEGNVWEKDDSNKSKLTNAIKKVAHKNIRKISDWVGVHPNCKDSESNKNDLYLKIVSNSMSGCTDEEAEDNYNKIKRNIIKEVIINK